MPSSRTRHERIPTRNQTGWTSNRLNEVSRLFVDVCRNAPLPVLDLGAAYGIATIPALEAGATVVANDIDSAHLEVLASRVPPEHRPRLILSTGRFPRHLHFLESSFAAIHASNLLHFLTGPQLTQAAASIAHWLAPSGRAFIHASTPWQKPWARFIPVFEQRRADGAEFPGWMEDTRTHSDHGKLSQIPKSIHLLDDTVLTRVFSAAGLTVDRCWLYRREDLPASLFYDGRECVGLIASKPEPPSTPAPDQSAE